MLSRNPISPGRFYPADAQVLLGQLEACYRHPFGPGGFPPPGLEPIQSNSGKPPRVLVVPHGALGHSGPIAAHAYAQLAAWSGAENGLIPRLIVLLGPDHLGRGEAISTTALSYATPLGVVPTDQPLVRRLREQARLQGSGDRLVDAPAGHREEHALENQVPFIQHLAWRLSSEPGVTLPPRPGSGFTGLPNLLPLTMAAQDLATAETLARLLDAVLPTDGVLLLVTSDMSHCGSIYGNLPSSTTEDTDAIAAWCSQQSDLAIQAITSMNAANLVECFFAQHLSMCGLGCMATAIIFACLRGGTTMRLLASADSVSVARGWRGHVPTDNYGNVLYPWNLLFEVDPRNPVGFAAFALF
jgi:predicted class III extradiol MEMO1 family dioxygenase